MELILLIMFMVSLSMNTGLGIRMVHLNSNPIVKTEYKEIEVVKRAVCECTHVSSMHNKQGCQQEMFKLDGQVTSKSFRCFCVKYVGPVPIQDYFDAQMLELETISE